MVDAGKAADRMTRDAVQGGGERRQRGWGLPTFAYSASASGFVTRFNEEMPGSWRRGSERRGEEERRVERGEEERRVERGGTRKCQLGVGVVAGGQPLRSEDREREGERKRR